MTRTTPSNRPDPEEAQARPRLILWQEAGPVQRAVVDALASRFAVDLRDTLPTPDEIAADTGMLLICQPPAQHLAGALAAGTAPATALADWTAQMGAVLALHRRNRGQVRLADGAILRRDPAAVLALFDLEVPAPPAGPDAGDTPDALMLALAWQCLYQNMTARTLLGEFSAATGLAGDGATQDEDPGAVLDAALCQSRDLREERALLQSQQLAMHDQLEALYREKLQIEQRLEQTGHGLDSYQAQVESLEAETAALRQQLGRKAAVIAAAGTEMRDLEARGAHQKRRIAALEADFDSRSRALAEEIDTHKAQLAAQKAEIDRVLNSRSHRITAPLRRLRAAMLGRGAR